MTGGGRRIRRLKTARWRRCRASGGPWIDGEEEGVEAELLGASARLGVVGGHGYGDDDGELRSVVCARGKQRSEGEGGPESEGEVRGGSGRRVASPGVEEGGNQAGGGQGEAGGGRGLSGARHASPLFVLLAEEEEDKGEEVGWAGQMELGQVSGAR